MHIGRVQVVDLSHCDMHIDGIFISGAGEEHGERYMNEGTRCA
jgi:hypothetical protein